MPKILDGLKLYTCKDVADLQKNVMKVGRLTLKTKLKVSDLIQL